MVSKDDFAAYLGKAINYQTYFANMQLEETEHSRFPLIHDKAQYIPLNITRMQRVTKTFEILPTLQIALNALQDNYTWLVLTEFWCGDAAQINPALNKIAEASNGKINLQFLYRDDHVALMDAFLTNGSRSIPKLICLNQNMEVVYTWGPRPAEAQDLVLSLKANPETKDIYAEKLHVWYARNRSQAIQNEILSLL